MQTYVQSIHIKLSLLKTMQTDNPKDNITLLITLVILLSETQLYISV